MSTETRSGQPRYWCHVCNAEVPIYMAPDPTCQRCNEQFIEELQSDDDPREFLGGGDNHDEEHERFHRASGINLPEISSAQFFTYSPSTGRVSNLGENGGEMGDDIFQFFTSARNASNNNEQQNSEGQQQTEGQEGDTGNNANPLNNFVQNILTNIIGQNVDLRTANQGTDENGQNRPMLFFGNVVDGNIRIETMPRSQNNNSGSENENEEGTGETNARGNNIAGILQFLSAMTGAPLDGGMVGNPNDYVFSQTALDNIITQLMEQTGGGSAPPPAPESVIDALTQRNLTDEEKSQETDCAVCKDQFEPAEKVIELPCKHIFHDECIKPWLKLNSTCPVCRHTVLPEGSEENNNTDSNTQGETNNNNNPSTETNNNNPTTRASAFSFPGPPNTPLGGQQRAQGQPVTIPLNLSAAFPYISNLVRQAENRPSGDSISSNNQSNNNSNNDAHPNLDDDLDLD